MDDVGLRFADAPRTGKRRRRRRFLGRVGQPGASIPGPPDARDRGVFEGERAIRRAVLHAAVMTIVKNARSMRPRGRRLFVEASEWVAADDRGWPFSFVNICDALDLSVSRVRSSIADLLPEECLERPQPPPAIVTWPAAAKRA